MSMAMRVSLMARLGLWNSGTVVCDYARLGPRTKGRHDRRRDRCREMKLEPNRMLAGTVAAVRLVGRSGNHPGGHRCLERIRGISVGQGAGHGRSEEHTSELQSLMRSSYAVFCLKKKTNKQTKNNTHRQMLLDT